MARKPSDNSGPIWSRLETGKISPEEFHDSFVEETGLHLSYEELKNAWTALLVDFPIERLQWLQEIGKRYKIFLFSNTNKIHYDVFTEMFHEQTGFKDFNKLFVKTYYSHEMGLRKPYPESYLYILNEQQLRPEETLFIDDTLKNIEGAKQVGLQTIHLVYPETVLDLKL